eukprot:CAMPEP_0184682064 /NCGR_PEP_ID=MMETSP0312-20130426/5589_1 /TAXON_ID=31354 /ORGANISM="Compsopogon coeruleus, Strain SAG 36.94" /LENGTH=145 /DNA_ID=CAMNT_0027133375 /DNA_START=43 /DNA_END=480 /DNA_ORIENTATION=+
MEPCGFVVGLSADVWFLGTRREGLSSRRRVEDMEGRLIGRPVECKRVRGMVVRGAAAPGDEDDEGMFDERAARVAEIQEVIDGLKQFRQRIVADATELAKKVKTSKKKLEESLSSHPDILKIDASIVQLESELQLLSATPDATEK